MSINFKYKILDAIYKKTVVCIAVLLFSVVSGYAANRYSVATGNWNATSTWSDATNGLPGFSAPVAGDIVYIQNTRTVTITADAACTSITFNGASATLTVNSGFTLTVSGAVALNSLSVSNTAATISGAGALSCASVQIGTNNPPTTGSAIRTTIMTSTIAGFTISGNLTISSFRGNNDNRLVNSTFNLASGSVNLSGALTTTNANAVNTSTFSMATGAQSGTLNLSAATPFNLALTGINTITLNGTSALVNYTRTNIQTGYVTTYTNLSLSGTSAKTFATTPTVSGILSMEGDATVVVTTGVVTYGAGATLKYNSTNPRTVSSEEWITPFAATGGVIIASTGTITLDGAKVLNASVPLAINNGATLATNNFQLTFGGNFVNGGTFTAGSSPIVIANTMTTQSITGFTTTGTVSMTKTAGTATFTGNVNGNGLTINGSGGTLNLGSGFTHTFTGAWTRTAGTLNGGSSLLKIGGSISGTGGTFTAGSGTVEWYAGGDQSIADVTYNNLTISGSGVKSLQGNTTVNGNLTLTAGTFAIGANTLTVSGTITNNVGNTGLVLKSDAGGDSKLIYSASSVPGTVELYLTGGLVSAGVGKYHYFVPPVQSMTIGASNSDVMTNLGITNFNGDLLEYDETKAIANKEKGWQYFDGWALTTAFSTITSTKGCNIYLTGNDIIKFKGQLNSAAHTFNLNYTATNPSPGWNLAGNPYPCNYDLNGISSLTSTGDNVDNTVYYTRDGAFYYWNVQTDMGSSGYSDIIPPMQGFFVKVLATGTSLVLPTASKTSSSSQNRSKGPVERSGEKGISISKVKLVLSSSSGSDEAIVCLIDDATSQFDSDYDAYKLFGSSPTAPYIYSVLEGTKYAINAVKGPVTVPVIIPVSVIIKQQGTYTINISEFENFEEMGVVLKHGNIETQLSQNATYTFTSNTGTFNDFQLIFNNISTGTETLPLNRESFKSWYSNEYLYINCPVDISAYHGRLDVYDMQGRVVHNNPDVSLVPGQTVQESIPLPKGFYITHIIVNRKKFASKIIVF